MEDIDRSVIAFDIEKFADTVTPIVTPITAKLEHNMLNLIGENNSVTREELANSMNVSINTIKTLILRMKKKGILERIGNNRTGYWKINQ